VLAILMDESTRERLLERVSKFARETLNSKLSTMFL
jgi:formylmethanofuran dehydrogenase subunit A